MRRQWPRAWRGRVAGSVLWLVGMASGCAYYNGVYNAQEAARMGDARLRRGAEADATTFFQSSAAAAESVLVRFPSSPWRARALYLAGRGTALGGQCDKAVVLLPQVLNGPLAEADRDRARVALASCELRTSRIAAARARLDSVVNSADPETARQARRWAARAALAAGDRDAVSRYADGRDDGAVPWDLMLASLAAQEYARVESVLVQQAQQAEYREDVVRAVRDLWSAGRWDGVERIVTDYDRARIRDGQRAALHLTVGDLNVRAGRDSVAQRHLQRARGFASGDTVVEREALARLAYLGITRAAELRQVDSVFAQQDSATRKTPYAKRVAEQVLLVRLFSQQEEPTGAALFLAGEVARDSLRAHALARGFFLRVARDMPTVPLAPAAWHAAAALTPDSVEVWYARIRRDYPSSFVAAWITGRDPASQPDFTVLPQLLDVRWTQTLRIWSDSVRKLRAPANSSAFPTRKG